LLGIKNTKMDPVLIKVLSSGIAVYMSLFKDVYGSRLIFAEVEQRCYAIRANEKLGFTVNPYSINKEDVMDCNGKVEDDFETCLDDHEKLRSILEVQENVCKMNIKMEVKKII